MSTAFSVTELSVVLTDLFLCSQALKKDVLQTKERELFTYFHLRPERLKQTVDNLEKRLQVHSLT